MPHPMDTEPIFGDSATVIEDTSRLQADCEAAMEIIAGERRGYREVGLTGDPTDRTAWRSATFRLGQLAVQCGDLTTAHTMADELRHQGARLWILSNNIREPGELPGTRLLQSVELKYGAVVSYVTAWRLGHLARSRA